MLLLMPDHLAPYVLEKYSAFTPDPEGCTHCRHDPSYPHRHWREQDRPPPLRMNGSVMRACIWLWGDWGIGRRRAGRAGRSGYGGG
jgi:hypothetical protein